MDITVTIQVGEQYVTPIKVTLTEAVPADPKMHAHFGAPDPVADYDAVRDIVKRLTIDAVQKVGAQISTAEDNAHALHEVKWDVYRRNKPDEATEIETLRANFRAQKRGDVAPMSVASAADAERAGDDEVHDARTDLHSVGSVARATDDDVMGDPAND